MRDGTSGNFDGESVAVNQAKSDKQMVIFWWFKNEVGRDRRASCSGDKEGEMPHRLPELLVVLGWVSRFQVW